MGFAQSIDQHRIRRGRILPPSRNRLRPPLHTDFGPIWRCSAGAPDRGALTVEFTVAGIARIGLNGGPMFKHNDAFSFIIATADQVETDRYWDAIVRNGGEESQCGWCRDKWGLSWQITPTVLTNAMAADGPAAKRAFEAMVPMKKIDVATIKAAVQGK